MRKFTMLFAFALLFGIQQEASAQFQIGPRVGYDLGDIEEPFVGVEARFGLAALPVLINPSVDYYFTEDFEVAGAEASTSLFTIKGNALYEFGVNNQSFTPYAGAGVIIGIVKSEFEFLGQSESETSTDFGLNLLGGARFMMGSLQPFVQAEVGLGDVDPLTIGGGILFTFGGS